MLGEPPKGANLLSSSRGDHDQPNTSDDRDGAQRRRDGNAFALLDGDFERPKLGGFAAPRVGETFEDQREETGANENESKDSHSSTT